MVTHSILNGTTPSTQDQPQIGAVNLESVLSLSKGDWSAIALFDAVLARPLSLPSYPVATGRPLPGHQRPRALRVRKGVKAGDRKSLNLNPGGPSRSSSICL